MHAAGSPGSQVSRGAAERKQPASGTHATGGLARRQLAAITSGSGGDVFVPARDKSDVPPIGSAVNPELGLEIAAARPVAREA